MPHGLFTPRSPEVNWPHIPFSRFKMPPNTLVTSEHDLVIFNPHRYSPPSGGAMRPRKDEGPSQIHFTRRTLLDNARARTHFPREELRVLCPIVHSECYRVSRPFNQPPRWLIFSLPHSEI